MAGVGPAPTERHSSPGPLVTDERQVHDGVIRAVQTIALPGARADRLARARSDSLERIIQAYLRESQRMSCGAVGARYRADTIRFGPPIGPAVLRFRVAERRQAPDGWQLTLRIVGGLLAERGSQRGTLSVGILPADGSLVVRFVLDSYRPSVAGLPVIGPLYDCFQAWLHSLHARRFADRLARSWPELLGITRA